MAALKHDAQGFLVGEPMDVGEAFAAWAEIKDDIHAIRQAVLGIEKAVTQPVQSAGAPRPTAPVVPSRPTAGQPGGASSITKIEQKSNVIALPAGRLGATGSVVAGGDGRSAGVSTAAQGSPVSSNAALVSVNAMPGAFLLASTGGDSPKSDKDRERERQVNRIDDSTKKVEDVIRSAKKASEAKVSVPSGRDAKGRFIPKDKTGESEGTGAQGEAAEGFLRGLTGRLSQIVTGTGSGIEEVDPSVKAINEIAQPMARGYELITGGDSQKKQEGWLRRIFRSVSGLKKEEELFNKVASKRLKAIEEKPFPESNSDTGLLSGMLGGFLGLMGGMLSKIPGLGGLAGAAGGVGGGIAGGAPGKGKGGTAPGGKPVAGGKAGFLRRLPIIGALIGGAGLALDIFNSENNETTTRQEKDRRAGKGIGGLAGSIAGMAGGAKIGATVGALGGPIGAAIGGFVGGAVGLFLGDQAGQIIGDKAGMWFSALREADIPGKLVAAWDTTLGLFRSGWSLIQAGWDEIKAIGLGTWDWVKSGWDGVTDKIKTGWDSISEQLKTTWNSALSTLSKGWETAKQLASSAAETVSEAANTANDYIRDKTGIDVKAGAAQAVETASNAVGAAKDAVVAAGSAVVEKASQIKDGAIDMGRRAVDAVSSGASSAWEGVKGAASSIVPQGLKDSINERRAARDAVTGPGGDFSRTLADKLPGRYRGKQSFDGVAGSAGLNMGTYTRDEANRIKELKASGANTGANVKGGMPEEIQRKIRASAEAHGLDPEMMLAIAAMESGGNPNAVSSTGAVGVYQFVGKTATGVGIKDRFDPDQNIEGGMRLTRQNAAMLKNAGLPQTPENIYMMHQLGPQAMEVIRGARDGKSVSELSASVRSGMSLNYGSKSSTAAEYLDKNRVALDARYERVVAKSDAGILAGSDSTVAQAPVSASPDSQPSPVSPALAGQGVAPPAQAVAMASARPVAVTDSSQAMRDPTDAERQQFEAAQKASREQMFQRSIDRAAERLTGTPSPHMLASAGAAAQAPVSASPDSQPSPVSPALASIAPMPAPAVVTVKSSPVSVAPVVPAVSDPPPIAVPMASNQGPEKDRKPQAAHSDVGQDLRERSIAHIVTGGFSGAA